MKDVKWRDVKVGQVLEVRDNEDFPADLLCLSCKRPDGVAYIRTTNLDGIPTLCLFTAPALLAIHPNLAGVLMEGIKRVSILMVQHNQALNKKVSHGYAVRRGVKPQDPESCGPQS